MPFIILFIAFLSGCSTSYTSAEKLSKAQAIVYAEEIAEIEFDEGTYESYLGEVLNSSVKSWVEEYAKDKKLNDEQKNRIAELTKEAFFTTYPRKLWMTEMSKVYTKHLSVDDMKGIIDFYNSKSGSNYRRVQAQILIDAAKAGDVLVQSKENVFKSKLSDLVKNDRILSDNADNINKSMKMSEAIKLCKGIQDNEKLPIQCEFDYYEGEPVMYVAFDEKVHMDKYLKNVVEELALPYCDSANTANRKASIVFVISKSSIAKVYSCETDKFSDWIELGNNKSSQNGM